MRSGILKSERDSASDSKRGYREPRTTRESQCAASPGFPAGNSGGLSLRHLRVSRSLCHTTTASTLLAYFSCWKRCRRPHRFGIHSGCRHFSTVLRDFRRTPEPQARNREFDCRRRHTHSFSGDCEQSQRPHLLALVQGLIAPAFSPSQSSTSPRNGIRAMLLLL